MTIILPLVYSKNIEESQKGNWREVLYSSPKKIVIEYDIDAKFITDIYAPKIKINSPVVKKNSDDETNSSDEEVEKDSFEQPKFEGVTEEVTDEVAEEVAEVVEEVKPKKRVVRRKKADAE